MYANLWFFFTPFPLYEQDADLFHYKVHATYLTLYASLWPLLPARCGHTLWEPPKRLSQSPSSYINRRSGDEDHRCTASHSNDLGAPRPANHSAWKWKEREISVWMQENATTVRRRTKHTQYVLSLVAVGILTIILDNTSIVGMLQRGNLPINCSSTKLANFPPLPGIKPVVCAWTCHIVAAMEVFFARRVNVQISLCFVP